MSKTTHLQGIGSVPAKAAQELQRGDIIRWNYGYTSTVLDLIPSASGKTVTAVLLENQSGKTVQRKLGSARLVGIFC